VQCTYFAYLGAIKEANGAAMSIGRISSFLDIYIERDIREGTLDEAGAQELCDQLVQKLRIVRFLRTPEYDALFSGDPYWATECVGGMDLNGNTTRSFRRRAGEDIPRSEVLLPPQGSWMLCPFRRVGRLRQADQQFR
jgi:formate C-acetyltransferase